MLNQRGSGVKNPYRFSTKEQDPSGLIYFGARYYDPRVGRFITQDPLAGKVTTPLSLNHYIYSLNNPVNLIDPFGMQTYVGGTPAEWRLAIQHPGAAMEVERARHEAEQATITKFGRQGHNDESDAYRHAYWSAEMSRRIGPELAEAFGTAHEQNRNQPVNERDMDLYNNKVGRELASNPANRNKSTKDLVDKALNKGMLQVAPGKKTKIIRR